MEVRNWEHAMKDIPDGFVETWYGLVPATIWENYTKRLMCEECEQYPADPPSKLCPGCEAYRMHTS